MVGLPTPGTSPGHAGAEPRPKRCCGERSGRCSPGTGLWRGVHAARRPLGRLPGTERDAGGPRAGLGRPSQLLGRGDLARSALIRSPAVGPAQANPNSCQAAAQGGPRLHLKACPALLQSLFTSSPQEAGQHFLNLTTASQAKLQPVSLGGSSH